MGSSLVPENSRSSDVGAENSPCDTEQTLQVLMSTTASVDEYDVGAEEA